MPENKLHWRSRLVQPTTFAAEYASLSTPTYRGSTVVFPTFADLRDGWREHLVSPAYGIYGTRTAIELSQRLAALEGAHGTFLTPSGQSAIALVYLALCTSGDHVLLPTTAYGPSKELAAGLLRRNGIEVELYDPHLGADIATLFRPNTTLVWCESPGSITMDVQDIPAIAAAAHAHGALVALDNTYSAGVLFDAFTHGVDVSMQALTKYIGGHSDVMLGSVSVASEAVLEKVGDTHRALGFSVSPDECQLALRGLQTLAIRLEHIERSTLEVARWLAARPEVERVLHPALPSCDGHALWQRDFTGSSGVFSFVLAPSFTPAQVLAFVDALELFYIGWSWGGTTSLVMAYPTLDRPTGTTGRLVRLSIGLESTTDLLADIGQALAAAKL